MSKSVHLILIDMQNSFMDYLRNGASVLPYLNADADRMVLPDGTEFLSALPVPGALDDVARVVNMIRRLGNKIKKITLTYDTHDHVHIGHPAFWRDQNGRMPPGMTPMPLDNVKNGMFHPINRFERVNNLGNQTFQEITEGYLAALEATGRQHMVWNEHCVAGTWGHNLHPELTLAVKEWQAQTGRLARRLNKGQFVFAESFGVFGALVPNTYAPETQLQEPYIRALAEDDLIVFGGQARTHCVLESMRQVVETLQFGKDYLEKIYILQDAMSNIPAAGPGVLDFPANADTFFNGLVSKGVNLTDTRTFLS
jgi:nicotinamidase/pyrazinamidase